MRTVYRRLLGLSLGLAWTVLATAVALTRAPWSNEAWNAIPALNLATHGAMYTSILEFRHTWLQGIDRHTYWQMPLNLVAQAAWFRMFGFGLLRERALSAVFAVIVLASWSRIVYRLTAMRSAAFVVILIAFETNFLIASVSGRMDMMCAALGSAGIAAWLELRSTAPRSALLAAHVLTAAAIMTHPCGALYAAALVLIGLLVSNFIGPRLSALDVPLIVLPYLVAAALWGLYIAQAPADFHAQFFGNSTGFSGEYTLRNRFSGLASPWHALGNEVRLRYLEPFGFFALRSLNAALRELWLLISLAATVTAVAIPRLRARRGVRVLLLAELLVFLMMTLLEGVKVQGYLVHSLPFLAAVTATTGAWLWENHKSTRTALIACLLVLTLSQVKNTLSIVRLDPLHKEFRVVTAYLQTNLRPGDRVIGGAELGYDLGFTDLLRDDVRLGYYTGLHPRFIVTPGWYRLWFEASAVRDPAVHAYIATLLRRDYRPVLARGEYIVYERVGPDVPK